MKEMKRYRALALFLCMIFIFSLAVSCTKKTYTVGGSNYIFVLNGDGCTAFNGAKVISERVPPDSQALIAYIQEALGGKVGKEYEDPYGQVRIMIITK